MGKRSRLLAASFVVVRHKRDALVVVLEGVFAAQEARLSLQGAVYIHLLSCNASSSLSKHI